MVCGCFKLSGSPTLLDRVHRILHTGGPIAYLQTSLWAHLPYFLLEFLILENGAYRFSRNVVTKLPHCTS